MYVFMIKDEKVFDKLFGKKIATVFKRRISIIL